MKSFMEEYGKSIVVAIVIVALIGVACVFRDSGTKSIKSILDNFLNKDGSNIGGVTVTNSSTPTKGQTITIDGDEYKVLSVDGNNAKLLSMNSIGSYEYSEEDCNLTNYTYSTLQTHVDNWINSKTWVDAVVTSSISLKKYKKFTEAKEDAVFTTQYNWSDTKYYALHTGTYLPNPVTKKVRIPSIQDITEYLGTTDIKSSDLNEMFFNQTSAVNKKIWLLNRLDGRSDSVWVVDGNTGSCSSAFVYYKQDTRVIFTIDLTKVEYTI